MESDSFKSALSRLGKHRLDVLDTMDQLRALGVAHFIDLPQVIVCGDQSSGKSSVLEAISGLNFPRNDNLCTRFATEVIMRRSSSQSASISIVPHPGRSDEEKASFKAFDNHDISLDDLADTIEKAKIAMDISESGQRFSKDILRIEVSGPDKPHLTLVDLPGLFWAGTKAQSEDDAKSVQDLVLSYMRSKRSIILAVVSAKNDLANQIVTKYAREEDPEGRRTLGVITKPDVLFAGSDSEAAFIKLAENKEIYFRHGWHVVKNRDYNTRDTSADERNDSEHAFFAEGAWAALPRAQKGIPSLGPRLSSLLQGQIVAELPTLIKEVGEHIEKTQTSLQHLGQAREGLAAQRSFLLAISQRFTELLKASVAGEYSDKFFGKFPSSQSYERRIRAVYQNVSTEFASCMRENGQAYRIGGETAEGDQTDDDQEDVHRSRSREDFLEEVMSMMRASRGRELPGTYNPNLVGQLFRQQSEPWSEIVSKHLEDMSHAASKTLLSILLECTDRRTAFKIKHTLIKPAFADLENNARATADQIMRPFAEGDPITYNHYFTDNLQKIRGKHHGEDMKSTLRSFFGSTYDVSTDQVNAKFTLSDLVDRLTQTTQANMDKFAASDLIDCMQAYYKVALKSVVDNVSVLCLSECLLVRLADLFTPSKAAELTDEQVISLAGESEDLVEERKQQAQKLKVLQEASTLLTRLCEEEAS